MIHYCKACEYKTSRIYDLKVHTKSVRHLKRAKMYSGEDNMFEIIHSDQLPADKNSECDLICEEINKKNITDTEKKPTKTYSCPYCNLVLSCSQNVCRHKKLCKFKDAPLKKTINVPSDDFAELINIIKPHQINPSQPNKVLKLAKNLTNNKEVDIMSKILLSSFGIVYLVQPEIYLNTNVYKVGMSDKPLIDRIKNYGSCSRVLFLMECNMAYELEQQIISAFNKKFKIHKGKEYFEGTEFEMTNIFMELCVTHKLTNCIGKDTLLLNTNQNVISTK